MRISHVAVIRDEPVGEKVCHRSLRERRRERRPGLRQFPFLCLRRFLRTVRAKPAKRIVLVAHLRRDLTRNTRGNRVREPHRLVRSRMRDEDRPRRALPIPRG